MKCRYVCDGLNVVGRPKKIGVGDGNGGHLVKRDRLWEGGAEIGIRPAAIADEPTGVDVELREVGQPASARRSCGRAAWQSVKLNEIDWVRAFGCEIGVDEGSVANFIQCVALDVLRAIAIEV